MRVERYQLIFWETIWALSYLSIASLFFIDMRFSLYLVGLLSLGFAAFRLTSKQSWRLFYLFCVGYAVGIWFRIVVVELPLKINQELIELSMILLLGVGFVIMGQAMMRLREANKIKTEELKSALQRLETVTLQDDLTSVYNRKHIIDVMRRFHSLYKRNKTPVSICYIDVDSFRNINESFGHLAGDEVLTQISKLADDACRDSDVFGRLGGEEFILVLPETNIHGATVFGKRLNKLVKELRFNSIHYMLQVTVSIGIAQINDNESVETFIKRAELAMIEAKEAGKDRVCCSTGSDSAPN